MTRDEFFQDVAEALRLLRRLGAPVAPEAEVARTIEAMKAGGPGINPDDLRRHAQAIDWARQDDARLLAHLAQVLLRLVVGLASELEAFRRARD